MKRDAFDTTHKVRTDGQIHMGALNLEGMTDDELACVVAHPALHLDVRACARLILLAREDRLAGRIANAMRHESKLETRYSMLPRARA